MKFEDGEKYVTIILQSTLEGRPVKCSPHSLQLALSAIGFYNRFQLENNEKAIVPVEVDALAAANTVTLHGIDTPLSYGTSHPLLSTHSLIC